AMSDLGHEADEPAHRIGEAPAGTRFEQLAEQHEHHDGRARFEVQVRNSAVFGVREETGRYECARGVAPRREGTQAYERVHVACSMLQGYPGELQEAHARPEKNARGERKLDPARDG